MTELKPTLGRIVWFKSKNPDDLGNGAEEVPAIITRVWSDTCINCTVFRDCNTPMSATSVSMADDFEDSGQYQAWRWMPYQKAVAAGQIEPTKHAT